MLLIHYLLPFFHVNNVRWSGAGVVDREVQLNYTRIENMILHMQVVVGRVMTSVLVCHGFGAFVQFLSLHAPVLEPDLDLTFAQL